MIHSCRGALRPPTDRLGARVLASKRWERKAGARSAPLRTMMILSEAPHEQRVAGVAADGADLARQRDARECRHRLQHHAHLQR